MASEQDPLLAPIASHDDLREPGPRIRRSAWQTVTTGTEIVVVAFMFYYAAVMPLVGQFIYIKVADMMNYTGPLPNSVNVSREFCENMNTSDPVYLQQQDLQSRSAVYNYLNTAVALIPCFFSCIFLGSYSDRAGRKIAILLPIVGSILKLIVFVIVMAFKFHVAFIFIGSFIDGCFGGTATLLMGCFSYISDITSMSNRSFRVVVLEVCIGIGVVISQTIIGVIIHYLGYLWPFAILAGLNFLLFIYVVFRVKETVVPSEPVPFLQATYFTKPLYLYIKDPEKTGRRPKLIISLIVITVISGTALSGVTIEMMKLMNSPLCWSSIYIGLFFAMKYLLATSGTVAFTKLFQVRFGDLKLVIIGCVSAAVYQVAFSFAVHDWQVFTVTLLGLLSLLPVGLLRAYLSKVVRPHEVGSVFASVAWAELVGSLLGSLMYLNIYRATLTPAYLSGLVFQVMGLIIIAMMVLVSCLQLTSPGSEHGNSAKTLLAGTISETINS